MWTLDDLADASRYMRREVRGPLKRFGDVLPGGLLLGTLGFSFLVAYYPQSQEIFRALLESDSPVTLEALAGLASIFFVSGLLFFACQSYLASVRGRLSNLRGGQEYNNPAVKVIAAAGVTAAAAGPWVACILSVYFMHGWVVEAHNKLGKSLREAGHTAEGRTALELLDRVEGRSLWAIGVLALLGICALWFLWRCYRWQDRRLWAYFMPWVFFGLAFADLAVLGVFAAWFGYSFIGFYEALGPLATAMITVAGLFSIGLAITWTARAAGLATYFGLLLLVLMAVASAWFFGDSRAGPAEKAKDGKRLEDAVKEWIEARRPQQEGGTIPLIIVSAQGGGMYAAIVSAVFMSRLQDAKPQPQSMEKRFNSYVFAVSSVSGGSIGTGLYYAAANGAVCHSSPDKGVAPYSGGDIESAVSGLAQKPYLAAIAGNVTSDVVRRLTPWKEFDTDRAEAFKQSLLNVCPALAADYDGDWSPEQRKPALVLNTTWMSSGHRVAFAPFSLRTARDADGTLWSFSDVYSAHPAYRHGKPFNPSIAEAIVASARFPGLLPPLSLTHRSKEGVKRHNFGDGGYADASGAATAFEMFRAVRKTAGISPYLLMLTFDYDEVNAEKQSSSPFVETYEPLSALLGVRENLASQAITRVERVPFTQDKYWRVSVKPEEYGIALGLHLSRTSFEILSLLIGHAEWCTDPSYAGDNPILRNSCVAKRVTAAVAGQG